MDQNAATSARPAIVGDTLSFNADPDSPKDLLECTINWQQGFIPRSNQYMVFKAKNVTAGDTDFVVPVFVQKSCYDKRFGSAVGIVEFKITTDWEYGQQNETGAGRFIVLHDIKNKPFQDRFIAGWLTQLLTLIHGVVCAAGHAGIADKVTEMIRAYLGKSLLSYASPVVQTGDVLLVPSKLKPDSSEHNKTIKWVQNRSEKSAEYYSFTVVNATHGGQDVRFFIQRDWWDSESTSDGHISKVAPKNANGDYEFKIDDKAQYGQADESGQDRWVVYHDKTRETYQHRFVKSLLLLLIDMILQNPEIAEVLAINAVHVDSEEILDLIGKVFGDPLHTFT